MERSQNPGLVLRIVSGPEAGRSLVLEPGRRVRIGRSPPAAEAGASVVDLVVDDKRLSRLHCEVRSSAGEWTLRDSGSSNGTFLNGERVAERALCPGDLVQAGSVVLEVVDPSAPPAQPAAARPAISRPTPLRRRRSRKPSPLAGGVVAVVAVALAIAAALALRGRGREAGPEPPPAASAPAAERAGRAEVAAPPRRAKKDAPPALAEGIAPGPGGTGEIPIEVVAAFLDEGDYRRALSYVEDLARREDGLDLKPLRKSILDRASADLAAAEKDAERAFQSGSASPGERLEEIALRIPDDLASEAALALERVNGLRQALHDHGKKVEAGTSGVRAALARLAFADAERLVAEMEAARRAAAGGGGDPGAAAEAALLREVRLAREAWRILEKDVDRRVAGGAVVSLAFADAVDAGGLAAGPYRIAKREEDDLALEKAGGSKKAAERRSSPLFSLDDRSLKALLGPVSGADPDVLEGLALLLFYRAGPTRAAAFARAESTLDPARRDALQGLFESVGDVWLPGRRDAIVEAARRLSSGGSKESWEDQCRRIGALARAWRERPGYDRERAALLDLFVQAKVECLKLDGLRGLFSAARAEVKGSRVKLAYDFSSDAQLEDFEKGLGRDSAVELDGGRLVLKGECRLFSGEPFERSLTVRGKSPAGGFNPSAPNIAIGLFLRQQDRLRNEGGRPTSLFALLGASAGPEPNDYVVFAVGYRTAVADYGGKPLENLYLSGQTDPIPLPAHAILFGWRGKPLHTDARECPWAVKAAPIGGAVSFEATAAPDRLEWKLNGKTLLEGGSALERWAAGRDRIGSVALLTHAAEVRLSLLEVEGELRAAWLAERFKGEALRAFREFDPGA
jgi:hypothetical protein